MQCQPCQTYFVPAKRMPSDEQRKTGSRTAGRRSLVPEERFQSADIRGTSAEILVVSDSAQSQPIGLVTCPNCRVVMDRISLTETRRWIAL
jgi:hypothetical protein